MTWMALIASLALRSIPEQNEAQHLPHFFKNSIPPRPRDLPYGSVSWNTIIRRLIVYGFY